ncbi:protein TolR [Jannaschia rubra]|uniref:Biopolymer transport protein ExbD n=1 Tax=Jannaschia rubra TaxID=282197 RepID=A0A0M6XU54_9RHOB|nr:protein TolR [Jannaschia rubra]CTQ33813.1 Biopolymer transport protein ExbD [Jannaschia rubra]SFG09750.1 Cell division and transport-associated protein TolR [Jannaschia rubra]
MGGGTIQPGGGANTRRRRRVGSGGAPMSEINVTPFVDVMLVLLIIFMVAAPLLTAGVPIELPETAAAPLPQEQEEPLAVTVAADGRILIGSTEVPREEFLTRLRAVAAEREGDKVFLRADGAVPYSEVMVVMGALNAGGFRNIGLVTEAGGPTLDDAPAGDEAGQ